MKKTLFTTILVLACQLTFAQTVPSYLPTTGLLAWYPFNSNAHDESGNSHNGIVGVNTVLTTDRLGSVNSAYHFNGINSNIISVDSFFDFGLHNMTISCWLNADTMSNPNNVDGNNQIINTIPHNALACSHNWGGSGKYSLWVNSNPSSITWSLVPNGKTNTPTTVHNWVHFLVKKTNDTAYGVYVNGRRDTVFHVSASTLSRHCKISIGRTDTNIAMQTFFGKLDDYAIWNVSLSDSEIADVYFAITGNTNICKHATTALSSFVTGGTWSCTPSSVATINPGTGVLTGVASGTVIVTYTVGTLSGHIPVTVTSSHYCDSLLEVGNIVAGQIPAASVFPNPSTGSFSVKITGDIGEGATIVITDIAGKVVTRRFFESSNNSQVISDFSNFAPGIYFIKTATGKGTFHNKITVD